MKERKQQEVMWGRSGARVSEAVQQIKMKTESWNLSLKVWEWGESRETSWSQSWHFYPLRWVVWIRELLHDVGRKRTSWRETKFLHFGFICFIFKKLLCFKDSVGIFKGLCILEKNVIAIRSINSYIGLIMGIFTRKIDLGEKTVDPKWSNRKNLLRKVRGDCHNK